MTKKVLLIVVCAVLLVSLLAYGALNSQLFSSPSVDANNASRGNDNQTQPTTTPIGTTQPTTSQNPTNPNPTINSGGSSSTGPTPAPTEMPITDISVQHEKDHEKAEDYVWNSSEVINISLNGNSITTTAPSTATIEGSKITITSAGTYRITGSLIDGQIIVNTQDKDTTRLILSNIDVTCSNSAPIYILDAKKAIIILEDNTINMLKDTAVGSSVEPNAALFSAVDLTIYGTGQLNVQGNNNDAISSKDGLIIKSGIVTVNSLDDGIRGKDYLIVKDGVVTVTAGGDGLKSDNAANASRGYVTIEGGTFTITSGGDALEAQTDVTVISGQITATSGGGSSGYIGSASAKGIKAITNITIVTGTFTFNSADDCLHSNKTLTINGGSFTLSSGDDAIHSDDYLTINGGTISIPKAYEGIESSDITINDATIHLTSSDDGINGAGGNDGSGFKPGPGVGPGQGFVPGNRHLYINGGYIVITSVGDGIDVNGPITMTGGYVIVNGPTFSGNSAIDWEGSFKMTGGFILGMGSSGMAMTTSDTSTQYSVLINFRTAKSSSTLVHIQSNTGADILTFQPTKQFQSIALCSPALTKGSTYEVYLGGSCTGTLNDGVYQNPVYTGGTRATTFTVSGMVTRLNNV